MADFLPTSLYDYPSTLLAQVIDGNMPHPGMNIHDLSPNERTTVAEKVTKAMGWENDRFLSSVADTVLNPWVILFAATSALGGFKLPGAGELFSGTEGVSAFVRKHGGIAQTLRLLSPAQMLRGTFLEPAFMQASKEIESLGNEVAGRLAPHFDDLSSRLGLTKGLATDSPMAKEVGDLLHIKLAGLDVDRVAKSWGQGGKLVEKLVPALVDQRVVDQRIGELGLGPMVEAMRNEFTQAKTMLFGQDGAATFTPDPAKILKVQRNLRDGAFRGYTGQALEGIVGEDLMKKALAEGATAKDFMDQVAQRFASGLDEQYYMPRNQFITRDIRGREIPPEVRLTQRQGATLATTNAAAPRTRSSPLLDVEDLNRLRQYATDQTQIEKQIERASAFLKSAAEDGKSAVRFDKINFSDAFQKYMNDAVRSKALFLSEPGEVVFREMERSVPVARAAIEQGMHRIPSVEVAPKFEWLDETGKQTRSIADVLTPGDAPPGGWSIADAIWQGHQLTNDRVVQNTISDLFVPTLTGQMGPRGGLMTAVQLHAQKLTEGILDTMGPAFDNAGEYGQKIKGALQSFVDRDISTGRGVWKSGALAGLLYSSHLGLNLASAGMNLVQPLITTGRFVEAPYLMEGYGEALKAMGRYVTGRASIAKPFLTSAEKWKVMSDAIPVDVLEDANIGPSALELIDAVGFSGEKLRPATGFLDRVQEASLKMFEKTEWMNRLSTVYAQRAKQAAAGLDVLDAGARQEVRSLVNETQFGGHWLNTPTAFLDPGSPFSNPLLRQFVTFPLRMMLLTTNVARDIGGPNQWANMGRDMIRAAGLSAIAYEAGKRYIGPGIERGLYFGTMDDTLQHPPIPPIIDIPLNAYKALTAGDADAIKKEIPRLFPGGVAVSKAIALAPDLSGTPFGAIQRQYVDWKNPLPTGEVPLMKSDGSLIEYVQPGELVMRKVGLSRSDTNAADRDRWLIGQREKILDYRRQALKALGANDPVQLENIKKEFSDKFGFDLTVTQDQVKQWQRIQSVPRTDRILRSLPHAAQGVYAGMVGNQMQANTGIPAGEFDASIKNREAASARYTQPAFDPMQPFTPF